MFPAVMVAIVFSAASSQYMCDWPVDYANRDVLQIFNLSNKPVNTLCISLYPENGGPLDIPDHGACCALSLPFHLHPRLH